MTNKEKIAAAFPGIHAKLIKLQTSVGVKKSLDVEDQLVLKEVIDWLTEWGEEQERLYEEYTGEPFPKLKKEHTNMSESTLKFLEQTVDDYIDIGPDSDAPIIGDILAGIRIAQELIAEDDFYAMSKLIVDSARLATISKELYQLVLKYPLPNTNEGEE